MRYVRFFFGTPRRLMWSALAGLFLFVFIGEQIVPGYAGGAISHALTVLLGTLLGVFVQLFSQYGEPVVKFLLTIVLIGIGFRFITKGFGGKKKK